VTSPLRFELHATAKSGARAGTLHTRRGSLPTPTFMPVATHANVRHLSAEEVKASGAGIILANTWHLKLRPGAEVFEHFGGIHQFMQWPGGVLTDSGGFQIFSLPDERNLTEEGAHFKSPFDNHQHMLSPESSIATQQSIGSDIMMVLDVCLPSTSDEEPTRVAMEQTHRWAIRSLAAKDAKQTGQALFAIVQGGIYPALRTQSAEFLRQHPFDGFAIGGLAVGEARELLYSITAHTAQLLPQDKPRYLMGVGTPIDLVESVRSGVDMFDCILPTKMAQQGYAYTYQGMLRLPRSEFRLSDEPLEATCQCPVCRTHSRGYIHHLSHGGHAIAARLMGIHNLHFYQALMGRMREAIIANVFDEEYRVLKELLSPKVKTKPIEGRRDGDFELITLKSGARAVRHLGHGEVMHPGVGPWEEANHLYVKQTGLQELISLKGARRPGEKALRILDIGLGAASNAVAALTCAREVGAGRRRGVEVVSLEHDLAPLRLALDDPEGFDFLVPFADAARTLIKEGFWEGEGLQWRLLTGDAMHKLEEVGKDFELVFQDPFSPDQNPALWTVKWLERVRALAHPDGMQLVTYSSATPTRVSLLLAGYFVGAGVSTGLRGETTIASTKLDQLRQPLQHRWLKRWERSSARAPHGAALTPEMEEVIRKHPQFV
jgi:queuine tRNA-ribosyltransferase